MRAHQSIRQNSQQQRHRRKPCKLSANCNECFYPSAIIRNKKQVDGSFFKYRLILIRIISITLKIIIHVVSFTHNINYVYELFNSILILMNSESKCNYHNNMQEYFSAAGYWVYISIVKKKPCHDQVF